MATNKENKSVLLVIKTLQEKLQGHAVAHAVVGYSGGMDSHVLLHALATHLPSVTVEAIHVNHGQSAQAESWEQHALTTCAQLNVPYSSCRLSAVVPAGESTEAYLRELRYAELNKYVLTAETALLVGHHADDQAETVLLRLLRGSGPAGLGAMRESQVFSKGQLLRPLLSVSRQTLLDYAEYYQLNWVEDESNNNESFDRNYLRQTVLPLLQKRWPSLNKTVPRAAFLCQNNQDLVIEVASDDGVTESNPLNWEGLKDLSPQRQSNAIRCWLFLLGAQAPSYAQLLDFLQQMCVAAASRVPTLHMGTAMLRCYRNHLYYSPIVNESAIQLSWDLQSPLKLPGGQGLLLAREVMGQGLSRAKLSLPLCVATRRGGERIKMGNSHCHQRLKNCWQRWGVPPWLRAGYPLLFQGDALVAVPNHAHASEYAAASDEKGLVVQWQASLYDETII